MATACKLACLFMLLSGTRVNSLYNMLITSMYLTEEEVTFTFPVPLKHSRPGYTVPPLVFRAFPGEPALCPVQTLNKYLAHRLWASSDEYLFSTTTEPKHRATSDTIQRWIKSTMLGAGIDTGKFKPHSIRGASTSGTKLMGIRMDTILRSANWSRETTFKRHYWREIEQVFPQEENFGEQVLLNAL